jgi:hypothetical protein
VERAEIGEVMAAVEMLEKRLTGDLRLTQFTGFTSTKVQILTQKLQGRPSPPQKYKY